MRKYLSVAACLSALMAAQGAMAEDVTLKIASYLPPQSVTVTKILNPFIKGIETETKGSVKFQPFWGGALGRNPEMQYKLVTDGIGDIFYMSTYLSGGQFPDSTLFDLPGLLQNSAEGSVAYWRMYKTGMLRGFNDVKVVGLYMTSMNGIHTRKPFKTLEDLKGMKIRATGSVIADFIKQFGAVPVYMSNNDMPQALGNGVVDGLTNEWTGLTTFKLQNLVHYHYEAPMGATTFVIAMNSESWKKLTPDQQAAIDKFGGETMSREGGIAYDAAGVTRRAPSEKDQKHVFIWPSKGEWDANVAKYAKPIWQEWIKETPDGQKKFDTFVKIVDDLRAGK